MAVALDASTPARWSGTTAGQTSAAFTAPANALLVVVVEFDASAANASLQTVADSGGLVWTNQVARIGTESTTGGLSQISTARTVSAVSRTITVTQAGASGTNRISAVCYVWTTVDVDGTPVDSVTASNEGGSAADPTTTTSLTPGANGVLVVACTDWNAPGAMTSSDLNGIDSVAGSSHAEYAGAIDVLDGWKTCTSGVGVTGNLNPAAGPQLKWCEIIVREVGGVATVARPQSRPFPFSAGSPPSRNQPYR